MEDIIRSFLFFLREWFSLDNAPNAFVWTLILLLTGYALSQFWNIVGTGRAERRKLQPDQEGRYPVHIIKKRDATVYYDREKGTITTVKYKYNPKSRLVEPDVEIRDISEEAMAINRDIELARAHSRKLVPVNVTDSRNIHAPQEQYTYAPSNVSERTNVGDTVEELEEETNTRPELPPMVDLFETLEAREPGHVIMGVGEDDQLVQVPISQIFHHLVGGMSGWGKSIHLRSLVFQLMKEADTSGIKIGLADIENNTFPEFRGKDHIDWFASDAIEIEHMTSYMLREVERRKTLYESMRGGTPKDIDRYNALARRELKEELPVIVLVYDEFSAFMANRAQAQQKRILADIYQLALRARKYGIFLVLAGQSFKSDVVDTTVTGQFGFNICFKVRTVQTSLSIIGTPGAESLTQPGEALMKTKDGRIIRLQALFVDDDQLIEALVKYESENHTSLVPELVKEIIFYSREHLENRVLIRELERHFRQKGMSRKDVMNGIEWMDLHHFTIRSEKNARTLNEEVIRGYESADETEE
jgi:hypothetical protein